MRLTRPAAFVLSLTALLAWEGYTLFVKEVGTVAHMPAARDTYLTREIRGTDFVTQSFILLADGFDAFEVFPRPSSQPPVGPIRFRIFDGEQLITTTTVETAGLDLTAPLRVPVPYMDNSAGRVFVVEIMLQDATPGHGLRFEAGSPTYLHGNMQISGVTDWGDLKFRTHAERTSIFRNLQKVRRAWPAPVRSDAFLIAALIAGNAALALVMWTLAFAAPEPGSGQPQGLKGSEGTTAVQPRV
jgi:hypothetical protein